jgi:hypothetical protein
VWPPAYERLKNACQASSEHLTVLLDVPVQHKDLSRIKTRRARQRDEKVATVALHAVCFAADDVILAAKELASRLN